MLVFQTSVFRVLLVVEQAGALCARSRLVAGIAKILFCVSMLSFSLLVFWVPAFQAANHYGRAFVVEFIRQEGGKFAHML